MFLCELVRTPKYEPRFSKGLDAKVPTCFATASRHFRPLIRVTPSRASIVGSRQYNDIPEQLLTYGSRVLGILGLCIPPDFEIQPLEAYETL